MSDFSDDIADLEIDEKTTFDENDTESETTSSGRDSVELDEEGFSAEGYIVEEQAYKVEADTRRYEDYVWQQTSTDNTCDTSSLANGVEKQAERIEADAIAFSDAVKKRSELVADSNDDNDAMADAAETIEKQAEILEEKTREFEKRVIARSRELRARTKEQSSDNAQKRSSGTDPNTQNDATDETDTLTETVTVSETDTVFEADGTIESQTTVKAQKVEEKIVTKPRTRQRKTGTEPQKRSSKSQRTAGTKK